MSVTVHKTYPRLPWWQRTILKMAGVEMVAVVNTLIHQDGTVFTETLWLTGVDTRLPIAAESETGVTIRIEPLPWGAD